MVLAQINFFLIPSSLLPKKFRYKASPFMDKKEKNLLANPFIREEVIINY